MRHIFKDIRFALRLMLRNPGFTLVTALILALGIGLNTAIFSLVHAVLLAPLPFEGANQLLFMSERSTNFGSMSVSYPNFLDYQERQTVFTEIAAHRWEEHNLTGGDGPAEQVDGVHVSASLFPLLRVEPFLGRVFTRDEDQPGAPNLAVLSHNFWRRRLGADPDVVGQTLTLDGEPYEIIGVMPKGFVYPYQREPDLWTSLGRYAGTSESFMNRGNHPGITCTARLAPGVTLAQAQASMDAISAALEQDFPNTNTSVSTLSTPLQARLTRNMRPALLVLGSAVLLVLLIAAVNVANLHLARSTARAGEMAIRSALGAGRWRVFRQLLTESVMMALLGGALGLGLAYASLQGLLAILDPSMIPGFVKIELNQPVLLFTLGVSAAAGIFFGIAPALQLAKGDTADKLKDGARGSGGKPRQRLRGAFVVAEVALAMLLLVEALLFIKSFDHLTSSDPGFDASNLLVFEIGLPPAEYPEDEQQTLFYRQLRERLKSLPGVARVSHSLPLLGGWQSSVTGEGLPLPPMGDTPSTEIQRVGPDYFETVGLRLVKGRFLNEEDRSGGLQVAVVDEEFVETFWPGEEPLGKRWRFGRPDADHEDDAPEDPWIEIVGVVNHVKTYGVHEESRMQAYLPAAQSQIAYANFLLKTSGDPRSLVPLLQREVSALDPNVPVASVRTMEEHLGRRVIPQRLAATLLTLFAGLAVLLAALGIYGVMTYSVSQRRREVGIRMALGAGNRDVLRLLLGQGLRLAALGIVIGGSLVVLAAPLVASQLFGVDTRSPVFLGATAVALTTVAFLACLIPAVKALRVNLAATLRYE